MMMFTDIKNELSELRMFVKLIRKEQSTVLTRIHPATSSLIIFCTTSEKHSVDENAKVIECPNFDNHMCNAP